MKKTLAASSCLFMGAIAISMIASGCSRATAVSELRANGSWVRTVELHGPPPDKSGGLMPAGKLEDSFAIPGAPWIVTRATKDDGEVVTCKRTMQVGETLRRDVVCKGKSNGKSIVVAENECSIKEVTPGTYTYREVIHWIGPKPKDTIDLDTAKVLKSALPAGMATDASIKHLSDNFARDFLMALMGPPDPLLSTIFAQVMMNPDLAMHKLSARLGDSIERALVAEYGDKLTPRQRRSVVKKLTEMAMQSTAQKTNMDPTKPGDKNGDNSAGTALTFTVHMPGKILSCNGDIDKITNEVYWGMYPEAASMGEDVVLTATCRKSGAEAP